MSVNGIGILCVEPAPTCSRMSSELEHGAVYTEGRAQTALLGFWVTHGPREDETMPCVAEVELGGDRLCAVESASSFRTIACDALESWCSLERVASSTPHSHFLARYGLLCRSPSESEACPRH
eukprot:5554513-Amphidinium_carterae.1